MSQARSTNTVRGQMVATVPDDATLLEGPVLLAYGSDTLRVSGVLRDTVGSFRAKARYRKFKVRPDNPTTSWTTSSTGRTNTTPWCEDFDLSAGGLTPLGDNLWLQVALAGACTSGSVAEALGLFRASVEDNAAIVAHQTIQIEPNLNTGEVSIIPLGKGFAALGAKGVMVAAVVTGVSSTFKFNLVQRTFTADLELPSAWGSNLMGSDVSVTSDGDYNSGDLSLSLGTNSFGQIGLKITSIDARATIEIFVAVRY